MLSSCCCFGSWAVVCAPAVDRPLPLIADFCIDRSEFCLWPAGDGRWLRCFMATAYQHRLLRQNLLSYYNARRPHSALGNKPTASRPGGNNLLQNDN